MTSTTTTLDAALARLVEAIERTEGAPRAVARAAQALLDECGEDTVSHEAGRSALIAASQLGEAAPGAIRRLAGDPTAVLVAWERNADRLPPLRTRRAASAVAASALRIVCALRDGDLSVTDAFAGLRDEAAASGWDAWTLLQAVVALRAVVRDHAGERACLAALPA